MMYDVAVVGAGPAGSAAARICAEAGLHTLLLEEHATIGHPVQCAGLISIAAFDACRVSERCVLHRLTGAAVYPKEGLPLVFEAGATKAYAIDRGILDLEMAERAVDAGAELLLKQYVRSVHGCTLETLGAAGRREFRANVVIAADGVRSPVARSLGLGTPSQVLSGVQGEVRWSEGEEIVRIYPHASPDFFGWVIPIGKGRARVGLLGREGVMERFIPFCRRFQRSFTALVTGAVPLGPRGATSLDRVMLVGDAAGLAKPTSGGGIYTGVRSATHAASVALECCERGRFDDLPDAYERRWRQDLWRELQLGLHLLGLRQRMKPEEIDRVIGVLREREMVTKILEYGDMDRPSRLIHSLLGSHGLHELAGILLRSELRRLIGLIQPGQ